MKHKNIERVKEGEIIIKIELPDGFFELEGKKDEIIERAKYILDKLIYE